MNAATFEVLYSGFSRMHVQKTWEAILNTPLGLKDVLMGELVWATSKSLMSGVAILLVIWGLGLQADFGLSLGLVPVVMLTVEGSMREIQQAIGYGAKTYLTKPSSREGAA